MIWHEHYNPATPLVRKAVNIKLFMVSGLMLTLATAVCFSLHDTLEANILTRFQHVSTRLRAVNTNFA